MPESRRIELPIQKKQKPETENGMRQIGKEKQLLIESGGMRTKNHATGNARRECGHLKPRCGCNMAAHSVHAAVKTKRSFFRLIMLMAAAARTAGHCEKLGNHQYTNGLKPSDSLEVIESSA
jgi:hypothetical protein